MRRRHLLWMALWIGIGLSACMTTVPFLKPPLPKASPIETSKACADWRRIGIKKDPRRSCPKVPGWTASPLFRLCGERDETELSRFCVYEVTDPRREPEDVPRLPDGLVRFDRDCAAVSPSADTELKGKTWKKVSDHFLAQARGMEGALPEIRPDGRLASLEIPQKVEAPLETGPGVRLTFLDTQPDAKRVPTEWKNLNSRHGYTLTQIARHLLDNPSSRDGSSARIHTRLVLPLVKFDPKDPLKTETDRTKGGFFGTWSHLAQGIHEEVSDWQRDGTERRLVLNLSVAWDGDLFGELTENELSEMQAGEQAVYWALRDAVANGVLVLAAAGNQTYGPAPTTGPLLPAAWEQLRERGRGPLLYAVAGVQSSGYPLANARLGGLPRRVAFADHAVVADLQGEATATYTGSSVATAVVSSIAAYLWSVLPDLEPWEVMAILDASGEELHYRADFWFDSSLNEPPYVHQLSLRAALVEACKRHNDPPLCENRIPKTPIQPISLAPLLGPGPSRPRDTAFRWLASAPSPCKAEKMLYKKFGIQRPTPFPCPSDQFWGTSSQRWLFPQPDDPPCPNCVIVRPPENTTLSLDNSTASTATLYGEIPSDWDGGELVGATLDIRSVDASNQPVPGASQSFALFRRAIGAGDRFELRIPSQIPIDDRTTAVLSFVLKETGNTSVQSPVLITK